jgi:Icc-related predicted phosphoesterase
MRLLVFSDVHNDLRALDRLMNTEADHYFCAGDLVTWSRGLDACGPLLQSKKERVHVIPGNHESAKQIEDFCARYGLHYFHGGTIKLDGYQVAGLGYSSPTPFDTPGEYSEEELARRLSAFDTLSPLILVCHAPPRETELDRIRQGLHAGSSSVREFIEKHQPQYFFCGHIHEAEGAKIRMGQTIAVNVGKRGYVLEL